MSERLILALAGLPGCGKSESAIHLATKYGFKNFEGSTLISKAAAEKGIILRGRDSFQAEYRQLQAERGIGWLSKITLEAEADRIAQIGLRNRTDAKNIQGSWRCNCRPLLSR